VCAKEIEKLTDKFIIRIAVRLSAVRSSRYQVQNQIVGSIVYTL